MLYVHVCVRRTVSLALVGGALYTCLQILAVSFNILPFTPSPIIFNDLGTLTMDPATTTGGVDAISTLKAEKAELER